MGDDTVAFRLGDELSERLDDRLPGKDSDKSKSETLRKLLRKGLEAERLRKELNQARDDVREERRARDEAVDRANQAVEEMQSVREQWHRERLRLLLSVLVATVGLAAMQYPQYFIWGYLATGVGVIVVALHVGGIVDWVSGRRESVEGITNPPRVDRESGRNDSEVE
jgi:Arc/MetJ-type ribon-helix-helix transcriptional regulator